MRINPAELLGKSCLVVCSIFLMLMVSSVQAQEWQPDRLPDGQPNITGMWNNVGATATPVEMPDEFEGRVPTAEELADFIARRDEARKGNVCSLNECISGGQSVGAYGNEWFDWYWSDAVVDAPALVVDPPNGRIPAYTPAAQEAIRVNVVEEHDSAATVEAGDRCLSRGVFGMMMPTAYNNGKLILQSPGFVMIHSEMIHNARIIPIDAGDHVSDNIKLWEGDSRGRWEGNTLIIESTNFKYVRNIRAPGRGNPPQNEGRKMIETFTFEDENTLRYTLTVDDPLTYEAPWKVAFPYLKDNDYKQYEYACHEGNYAMETRLSGARVLERGLTETGNR